RVHHDAVLRVEDNDFARVHVRDVETVMRRIETLIIEPHCRTGQRDLLSHVEDWRTGCGVAGPARGGEANNCNDCEPMSAMRHAAIYGWSRASDALGSRRQRRMPIAIEWR